MWSHFQGEWWGNFQLLSTSNETETTPLWHCLCYEHRGEEAHRWCGQSSLTLQSLPNASIIWTNFHNLAMDKAFVSLDLDKLDSVNFDTKPHCKRKHCLHNSGNLGNIAIWLLRCKTSFGYWVRPSALGSIFAFQKEKVFSRDLNTLTYFLNNCLSAFYYHVANIQTFLISTNFCS